MHKRLIMTNIIIWSVIAGFLTLMLLIGITTGDDISDIFIFSKYYGVATKIQKQESVPLDNCDKIDLDFSSEDIVVYTTDESQLRIIEKSSFKLSEKEKFRLSKEGNGIKIKEGKKKSLKFSDTNKKFMIYIPKSYNKNLEIKAGAGDSTISDDIFLNNIKLKQSAGDFESKGSINANEIELRLIAGDIKINKLLVNSYNINTTCGDIDIASLSGSGKVETTTGDVKLYFPKEMSFEFNGNVPGGI